MIGNDPRYQAIIDAYKAGKLQTTAPQYNPIYDIRREQIEAGELPPGSRFPNPQLPTQPPAEDTPEEPFDPCPPGYQLIDGVCQPDTMFQQGGGNDREPYTGPKITDGIIEGYQELEPMQQKMGTFYQTLSPEMRAEYEKAASYGRGIQFKRDPQGNIVRIVAKSPTLGQLMGDIGGGISSMLGGIGDAAQQYLSGGGLLGYLANLFTPKQPTVRYGGSSNISVSTQPMIPTDSVIPTGIVSPGYSPSAFGDILIEPLMPIEKYVAQQELIKDIEKADRDSQPSVPKAGTGISGPPGRNYSSARSRAEKAASKLGTKLATRGR